MIANGEQIYAAMYPGPIFGNLFAEQTEVNVRQHALESFVHSLCDAEQGSGVSGELTS